MIEVAKFLLAASCILLIMIFIGFMDTRPWLARTVYWGLCAVPVLFFAGVILL